MKSRLALLLLASSVLAGGKTHSEYRNRALGFCVSYPASWSVVEPSDGMAAEFHPRGSKGPFAIEVSGTANQPSARDDSRPDTLEENVQLVIEGLKQEFGQVAGAKTESFSLGSLRAIRLNIEYPEKHTGQPMKWTEIFALSPDNRTLYALSLSEPLNDTALEPVFREVVHSFRLDCSEPAGAHTQANQH